MLSVTVLGTNNSGKLALPHLIYQGMEAQKHDVTCPQSHRQQQCQSRYHRRSAQLMDLLLTLHTPSPVTTNLRGLSLLPPSHQSPESRVLTAAHGTDSSLPQVPNLWHFLVLGGDSWGSKAPPSIALPGFSWGPERRGAGPPGNCAPSSRYPLSCSRPCTWLPSPSPTPVFRGLRSLSSPPIRDYLAYQRIHLPASSAGGQSGNTSLSMSLCTNLVLSARGWGGGRKDITKL